MSHASLFLVANYNWVWDSAQFISMLDHWKHLFQLVDISIYFLVIDKHTGTWNDLCFFWSEPDVCLQILCIGLTQAYSKSVIGNYQFRGFLSCNAHTEGFSAIKRFHRLHSKSKSGQLQLGFKLVLIGISKGISLNRAIYFQFIFLNNTYLHRGSHQPQQLNVAQFCPYFRSDLLWYQLKPLLSSVWSLFCSSIGKLTINRK